MNTHTNLYTLFVIWVLLGITANLIMNKALEIAQEDKALQDRLWDKLGSRLLLLDGLNRPEFMFMMRIAIFVFGIIFVVIAAMGFLEGKWDDWVRYPIYRHYRFYRMKWNRKKRLTA